MTSDSLIVAPKLEAKWMPYRKYRDSEVSWLGRLPEHWDQRALKRVFRIFNGATPKSTEDSYWNGDIPWVTPEDLGSLKGSIIGTTSRQITQAGYESCGTHLVAAGSLVLSTRAPIGHLGIAGVRLCTNQGCRSLVLSGEGDIRYFFYELLAARQELQSWGQGSTFMELATGKLGALQIAKPPLGEQQEIAAFLDRETAKIDALIAKREQLIALLEEKRAALINRAVTKGLDPNVPMKDSEIPSVGRIPRHWHVIRNRWVFREVDERSATGTEELLSVSHITGVTPRSEKEVYMFLAESNEGYKVCQPDDLAINTMWAYMGAVGIVPQRGIVSPSYNVYRLRRENEYVPKYLDYVYRTPAYVNEINRYSKGIWKSRLRLYPDAFFDMRTVTPPLPEQREVVKHISRCLKSLDALCERLRDSVEKLHEHRTALISAAVTGKIDVRGEAQ